MASLIPASAFGAFPGANGSFAVQVPRPSASPFVPCSYEDPPESCNNDQRRLALFNPVTRTSVLFPDCADPCQDRAPNWSPDGRQIVFTRGDREVSIVNADGSGLRTLTTGVTAAWSPDGAQLVVEDRVDGRRYDQLYLIDADGTNRRPLTFAGGSEPAWSSANRIAFTRLGRGGTGTNQVRVMRPGARHSRRLARAAENPDWSPNGHALVYSGTGGTTESARLFGIFTVGANGMKTRRIAKSGATPTWSPDGRQIAFTSDRGLATVSAAARSPRPRLLLRKGSDPAWQPVPPAR